MLDLHRYFEVSYEILNQFELVPIGDQRHVIGSIYNRWRKLDTESVRRYEEINPLTSFVSGNMSPYQVLAKILHFSTSLPKKVGTSKRLAESISQALTVCSSTLTVPGTRSVAVYG